MCGIWALLGQLVGQDVIDRCLKPIQARGPDATRSATVAPSVQLGFTRLAIK